MMGEAEKPGLFYLTGPTTLLEILSKAGGLSQDGRQGPGARPHRDRQGHRHAGRDRQHHPARWTSARSRRATSRRTSSLQNGDMMFVPKALRVLRARRGQQAPAPSRSTRRPSVLEAITLAGGFNGTARAVGREGPAADARRQAGDDLARPRRRRAQGQEVSRCRTAIPSSCPRATRSSSSARSRSRAPISSTRRPTSWRASPSRAASRTRPRRAARASSARPTAASRRSDVDMNDIIRRGQRDKAIRLLGERRHRRPGELLLKRAQARLVRAHVARRHLQGLLPDAAQAPVAGGRPLPADRVQRSAIWSFVQTPIYSGHRDGADRAGAAAGPQHPGSQPRWASPTQDYYRTQYEIMTSRPIVEKVIETLNLEDAHPRGWRARPTPAQCVPGHITVEPKRNTRLVSVTLRAPPIPPLAAEVANAAGAPVRASTTSTSSCKGAQEALAWLNEQMTSLRAKVQESSVGAAELPGQGRDHGAAGAAADHRRRRSWTSTSSISRAQAQRLSVEAKMNELQRIASDRGGAQTIFTVADSPLIQKLKQEASELEVEKAKLSKTYKDKHPEILKIDAQIEQVSQRHRGRDPERCCARCRRSSGWPRPARRRCSATSTGCAPRRRS